MKKKKEQIIAEAIRCAASHGMKKTNARLLAERLGIATSNIFYYFPKQPQLYEAMVSFIIEQNRKLVLQQHESLQPKTYFDRLKIYIQSNLLWASKYPEQLGTLMYSIASVSHNSHLKQVTQLALKGGEDNVYNILALGVAEKEFEIKIKIRDAAKTIHQSLMGSIVHLNIYHDLETPEIYYQRINHVIMALIKRL